MLHLSAAAPRDSLGAPAADGRANSGMDLALAAPYLGPVPPLLRWPPGHLEYRTAELGASHL
eukprot:2636692-Alexandrium_andersonii.AAC.1